MFESKSNGISSGTLYSFFPRNKRYKISKKGLNFIKTKNSLNKNSYNNKEFNQMNNDSFNINGISFLSQNQKVLEHQSSKKIFEIGNNKWNDNNNIHNQKQKYTPLAAATNKNFYRNSNNKMIQSSYGRKYYLSNGYEMSKEPKKKNQKIISKKTMGIDDKNRGFRVSSVEKNSINNRLIERFINQYESNMKKVLYEMGVMKEVQESSKKDLKNSNWDIIKSANIREEKKVNQGNKNFSDLPFLGNQNQEKYKNIHKKKKNYGYSNEKGGNSETNIININNFINFFSDFNNITYNNNNHNYNSNNNNIQHFGSNNVNNNNNNNNNNTNNLYGSATDTTINNNLASNSINSNIGNNNIIFSNSSNRNSFHQFSFNSKNIKIKSRSTNPINSAFISGTKLKKINSDNSAVHIEHNMLSPQTKESKENSNYLNNNYYSILNQKKIRASSTASRLRKENIISKDIIVKNENSNINMNNINSISSKHNINKADNSSISSSNYATLIPNNQNKSDKSKYEIGKVLGKGAYAVVKVVTNIFTKEQFAMKIYEKEKLSDNSKRKCVYREIEILKRVNHKNIAKLIEVINTPKQILIIQELVEGISLRDYYNREIRNQKGISEHKSMIFKKIFKQIFEAMNYLHKHHMAHRDIKLENILMTKDYVIKIIDFGFGMYNPENKLQNFFCGTPNYMPPEIAFKKPYVGQKADLWSLGVLVYKLFCADFPFKGKNEKDLYKCIKRGKFIMASYTPDYIKRIISNMIELDPNRRLTCENVLNSSWLRD